MSDELFIENPEEYNFIKRYLDNEGYFLSTPIYNDGIYTFDHCIRLGDSLIYKITARLIEGEIDYLSELVGWYVNENEEL